MPRYLVRSSFTTEGVQGTLREGGTRRREAVARLAESLGGRLEAFYYAFGEDDVYAIFDMPDNVAMAAASLAVAASGRHHPTTVVLVSPEEMDQVSRKTPDYRAPAAG